MTGSELPVLYTKKFRQQQHYSSTFVSYMLSATLRNVFKASLYQHIPITSACINNA